MSEKNTAVLIQEEVNDFLSNAEQERIAYFNSDPILVNAVRKVMLAEIYKNGTLRPDIAPDPLKNGALGLVFQGLHGQQKYTNEELGEDLRAFAQGVNLLESGFQRLSKFKQPAKSEPEENKAI